MPRLPTIRVIGSHAISTSWPGSRFAWDGSGMIVVIEVCSLTIRLRSCALPGAACARREFVALVSPARFLVERVFGDTAQVADHRAVQARCGGGYLAARRLVHERHEFVREPRHGASDADSADVRAAADAVDPASLGHVAFDHWAPAAQLHNAFRGSILGAEATLLVV